MAHGLRQDGWSRQSRQGAARALRTLAGVAAADLFATGLVTSALVALPVVMARTAYVVGAHFNWHRGLSERVGRARRFCAILAASTGLALVVSVANIVVIGILAAARVTGGLASSHRPRCQARCTHSQSGSGRSVQYARVGCTLG